MNPTETMMPLAEVSKVIPVSPQTLRRWSGSSPPPA
jgi:hypothetical protein